MARASSINDSKLRVLLVAEAKVGKTFWACEAAQAGYNLVYLDGDVGGQTVAMFDEETKERIYYFPIGDRIGEPRFSKHLRMLFESKTSKPFFWNDTEEKVFNPRLDDADNIAVSQLDLRKLTMNDVLVLDSWTSLAYSAKDEVAKRVGDDLGEMEKADRGIYASSGNRLTKFLVTLQHLPCHVIVIAHPDEWVREGKPTKQIPMSSSRAQGAQMGKYFTDVVWMSVSATGKRQLDGRPNPLAVIGSRLNGKKDTTEYSFAELVKQAGGAAPNPSAEFHAVIEHERGAFTPPELPKATKVLGDSSKPQQVKGLGGLVNKK